MSVRVTRERFDNTCKILLGTNGSASQESAYERLGTVWAMDDERTRNTSTKDTTNRPVTGGADLASNSSTLLLTEAARVEHGASKGFWESHCDGKGDKRRLDEHG